jgi:hypothetical protein
MVLLFAAHQGEELTLVLPAIMLVGAFFIFRWANQKPEDDEEAEAEAEPAAASVLSGYGREEDQVNGHVQSGVHD